MKTMCPYCGQCAEDAPREQHNEVCPNQYPIEACREHAIEDWQRGFDTTDPQTISPDDQENPIFQLGYQNGHPQS